MTRHPLRQETAPVVVGADDFEQRVIEPHDFVADTSAFIDIRLAGSAGKASYSFIGPGVSQNAEQSINITEPHGFNVGAASMPSGVVNNQHMHYTAEVFICTRGRWEMRLGQHGEQTIDIAANTVFSAPTWVFRGFKNIGEDDGWLFAVLGGDETGGILWAPQVLEAAAETGLHLSADYAVLDANAGDAIDGATKPVDSTRLGELDRYSDDDLNDLMVGPDRLEWSKAALLSSVLPGHGAAVAPVIGFGIAEDRRLRPPIRKPHGFTLEWLRVEPGDSSGMHRIDDTQVLILVDGDWSIKVNSGPDLIQRNVEAGSVVSVPSGAWREFVNVGATPATCLLVCGGDNRSLIDWDPALVTAAADRGWGRDASGYIAATDLLGRGATT